LGGPKPNVLVFCCGGFAKEFDNSLGEGVLKRISIILVWRGCLFLFLGLYKNRMSDVSLV
jgi:hypothetical protein